MAPGSWPCLSPSLVLAACHFSRELSVCILDTLVQPWHPAGLLRVPEVPAGPVREARPGSARGLQVWRGCSWESPLPLGCVVSSWKRGHSPALVKGLEQMCVVSVGTGAEWEGSFGDADMNRDWEGK